MVTRRRLLALLPRQLRDLPADLAVVALLTVAAALAAALPGVDGTPLRIVFGLPYLLFLPGYALVSALFPEAGPDRGSDGDDAGIDAVERVALAFVTSVAMVALVGLVLNATPWGIRLVPILTGVSAVTLGCTAVAARRRRALPAPERFRVPYRQWCGAARAKAFRPATRTDAALNVLLALSVLVATASVGYVVTTPKEGESFSELSLLTENEDGELVADGYPTEYVRGESRSLVVGVGNDEHEPRSYTVVVALQDVSVVGNETVVREHRELDRFETRLGHDETRYTEYDVTPTMTGTGLRLQFLLYSGDVPADPRRENAYRDVHLWVNVSQSSAA